MELWQVTTPYFCCGVEVEDDKIVNAAPIMRWAIGKPFMRVELWVMKKNGWMEKVE